MLLKRSMACALVLVLGLAGTGMARIARAESPEELLAKIRQETSKIKTLSAEFISVKKVAFLKQPIKSRGRLYYSSEGKIRWEILSPYQLAMTYDGAKVTRYTQEQPGVWKAMPEQFDPVLAEVMKQLQIWLSGQAFTMDKNYQVTITSQDPVQIQLTPKRSDMRKFLRSLDFTFASQLNTVRTLLLTEGSGDTTHIEYQQVRLDEPLAASLFQ